MPGRPGVSVNLSPEQKSARGRLAATSRTTADYYVRKLVEQDEPLTQRQREQLALLLMTQPADADAS